jgi:hypothetical protein
VCLTYYKFTCVTLGDMITSVGAEPECHVTGAMTAMVVQQHCLLISHTCPVSVRSYPPDLRHVIPSPLLFLPSVGYDSSASVRRRVRRRQWPGSTSPTAAATKSKLRLVRGLVVLRCSTGASHPHSHYSSPLHPTAAASLLLTLSLHYYHSCIPPLLPSNTPAPRPFSLFPVSSP